ncbi:putative Kinesin-II 85 kDa subunit [Blattamonas nauphoetae]|uniref:Kinesin-II 85 kDa subunit n=1 Tax=Blattamonas nauphoetae TaxID=2049346 RepID=A0ABQ9YBT8_9EUKA|nr:putative Kinesin-II 85 kDa subunit [Blattamonas nauphoetae]
MSDSVVVGLRVRPLNSKEKKEKCTEIQKISGKSITVTNPTSTKETKTFAFDYVYGPTTEQQTVFNDVGLLYLENAWKGFNCTLFAYGQTGAGKSFSMTGDMSSEATRGIIPRGCEEMFKRIKENNDENVSYEVKVSFLEMYNEKLQDLLDPKTSKTVSVRESTKKGIYIENALEEPVDSYEDINRLLEEGNKARTVAATAMNATSSRSHSVLTIFFSRKEKKGTATTQRESKINLVDLAGSERQSKTGATGERLTEAAAINKSLSALGNVIKALADISQGKKNIFVPYRDSLLTRMLQDSLGGNSKTIMIAAMSPASSNYDEGVSTLQYADRAKQIKNKPVVNESETDKMIKGLQAEIDALKAQLANGGAIPSDGSVGGTMSQEEMEAQLEKQRKQEEEIEKQREELERKREETAKQQAEWEAQKAALLEQQKGSNSDALKAELAKKLDEMNKQHELIQKKEEEEAQREIELMAKADEIATLAAQSEQARLDLEIAMKQLEEMNESHEEKMKRAAEYRKKREAYLDDMGLSLREIAESAGAEQGGPRLVNLSLSPDLSGCMVYFLLPGKVCVGSGTKAQMKIPSSSVDDEHAYFIYDPDTLKVSVEPIGDSRVMVNGEWVNSNLHELEVGDRLILGQSFVLKYTHYARAKAEGKIGQGNTVDAAEETDLIRAEMAVARGSCQSVQEWLNKEKAMSWLMHADEVIDEANELAEAMGRKINFGMDIVQEKNTVNVRVNSFEHGGTQEWDLSVLEGRLPEMREMAQQVRAGKKLKINPETDPFFNPPEDRMVGTVTLDLAGLMLAGAARQTLYIREDGKERGRVLGCVKVALTLKLRQGSAERLKLGGGNASVAAFVQCPTIAPTSDTFVEVEVEPTENEVKGETADGLQLGPIPVKQKVKLAKVVDSGAILDKHVQVSFEVKAIEFNDISPFYHGNVVTWQFPSEDEESNTSVSQKGEKKRTLSKEVHQYDIVRLDKDLLNKLQKTKMVMKVYGHAASFALDAQNEAEKNLARMKLELEIEKKKKLTSDFTKQQRTEDVEKIEKEIEELEKKKEELSKSKSCEIF